MPLLCLCSLSISTLFAQQFSYPPDAVLAAFNAEHLLVKTSSWSAYEPSIYRAEYTLFGDTRIYIAKYDRLGNAVEKQTQIDYTQLPLKAKAEIAEYFKNYYPAMCMQLMRTGETPGYKVTVEKWSLGHLFKQRYKVVLSAEGELLERSEVELDLPELASPPQSF